MRPPAFEQDNIPIYAPGILEKHEDYHAAFLDVIHDTEENHFWFLCRKERILSVFKKYVEKNELVLEIGAGTGNVSKALIESGYNVSVGEMHLNGLQHARRYGIKNCYQFDLFDPPFAEHFDVIGMFDVLEHLENDLLSLQHVLTMLKDGGRLVLTVPAFNFLWSRDDAYGHKRRYTIKSLKNVIKRSGFKILHARYFFTGILPLLFIRRFVKPDDGSPIRPDEYNWEIKMNPFLNYFLLIISRLENYLSSITPNFPGGSIIIVAEKKDV